MNHSTQRGNKHLIQALFFLLTYTTLLKAQITPPSLPNQSQINTRTPTLTLTSQTQPPIYNQKPNMMYNQAAPLNYMAYRPAIPQTNLMGYPPYPSNPMMISPLTAMSPYGQPMPYNIYSQYPRGLVQQQVETQHDRELRSINSEKTKLHNFFTQFIIVSKKHTFVTYPKFKYFYINYLQNAETKMQINHQERIYLENLNQFIFLDSYSHYVLHYKKIEIRITEIVDNEHSDILLALSNNKPFKLRDDYGMTQNAPHPSNIFNKPKPHHTKKKSPISIYERKKFEKEYNLLKKLFDNEQSWHHSLRNGKKNNMSSIRRIEIRKSIRSGQKKVKRLLKKLQKFEKNSKRHKITKIIRNKLKVIRYFLDMLFDRSIGQFFSKLSSYYHENGLDEKPKLASTRDSLKKKVRVLLKKDQPLRFLISVQRILKLNQKNIQNNIKKVQIKMIKNKNKRPTVYEILKNIDDPRQKAMLEVYIEQTQLRIKEIDFFLFDSPSHYFELDLIKLIESLMAYPSAKPFVQFNANLDLLFMQIAKIESHLKAGRQMEILPTVRQKYFEFFEKLIQPLIKPHSDFNLPQIEKKDREVFHNIKAIEAFRKVIDNHLDGKNKGKKIGDLDMSYLNNDEEISFENDIHKYLKKKNKNQNESQPLWDQDESDSWDSKDSFYKVDEGEIRSKTSEIDNDEIKQFNNLEKEFLDSTESDSVGDIKPGHRRKDIDSESNRKRGETSLTNNSHKSNKNSKNNKSNSDEESESSLDNIKPGNRRKDTDDDSSRKNKIQENEITSEKSNVRKSSQQLDTESQNTSKSQIEGKSNLKNVTLNNNKSKKNNSLDTPNSKTNKSNQKSYQIKKEIISGRTDISKTQININIGENNQNQMLDTESNDTELLNKKPDDPNFEFKGKKDKDEDKTIKIDDYDTDDGKIEQVASIDVKLKNKNQIEGAEVQVTEENVKNKKNGPKLKNVPVKIKKNTIRKKVWENGGFKKRKKKYNDQAFQADEDLLESMVVSMGDLKKVKVNKLLVLKTKILSELFLAFFKNEDENTTLQMLSSSSGLEQDGIIKKSLSQKLNYLLMIVVEGRKMRQGLVSNSYFDDVIRLWKLFLVEYSSTCQLKLYIKLLKKMDLIDPPRRRAVWANLMIFIKQHRQFDFIKCPQMILSMWMNKTILAKQVANTKTIRASFQKVFVKFKHQERVKAAERKKMLLKKILGKIRSHGVADAELQHFDKTVLLAPTTPGNKKKDDPSPNSPHDELDGRFRGSSIQSLMKKPSMAKLMSHLQKLKLKSSKKVNKDFMKFTKSLVIGALLSGNNVHHALSGLAKLRFKMTHKKIAYIQRLKTEFRNVDNIRVSDKYHHIFSNLKKIFFKHRERTHEESEPSEHESTPHRKSTPKTSTPRNSTPHSRSSKSSSYHSERSRFSEYSERPKIEPPVVHKKKRRWGKKITRRKKACRTRIFKKCKCTGSGTPGSGGKNGEDIGCCGDGTGDESIYNYRPSYEFKFEFDDPEELAQFEEFLRTTDSIDKLYSSNMIDVEKARNELKKAEFSKHYTVTVNGKKASPENILIPTPSSDKNSPDKENPSHDNKSPSNNSHEHETDSHSNQTHPNNDSHINNSHPNQSSPGHSNSNPTHHSDSNSSEENLKFNSLGDPELKDIESPFNDDTWEQDLKKIDEGFRNQPSIENGVHVQQIAVDENGNPIDPNKGPDPLDEKIQQRDEQDEEIREFIKRNRPLDDSLNNSDIPDSQKNSQNQSNPIKNQDELDQDVENVINKDLQDQDLLNANPINGKQNDELDENTNIMGLDRPQSLQSRGDEIDNRHVDLIDPDTSEISHPGNLNDVDQLDRPQNLDNVYSGELVDKVEDELDKNLPMKKYKFGSKDWDTNQVYTNEIKDEGSLGSRINKYPAMSDAMKSRLDKEIRDNGGYPDELDADVGKKKMVYFPFHVDHGDIQFDPTSNQQFLL